MLDSWTTQVAALGGEPHPNTASAMDLRRAAYRRASASRDRAVKCVQTTYAHRVFKHVLVTEFRCSNAGTSAVTVTLAEPGPHPIPAPTAELTNSSETSGIDGVSCSKMQVKWGETDVSPRAVVSECHTVCDGRRVSVGPGEKDAFFACVSARHTSVDGLGAPNADNDWGSKLIPPGTDPTPLAIASWKAANASAATLFAHHGTALAELQRPGIEVEGDGRLARVINSSVFSLFNTYRASEHFGGSASGLIHTCVADVFARSVACFPSGSWLTLMAWGFVRILTVSADILRRSLPACARAAGGAQGAHRAERGSRGRVLVSLIHPPFMQAAKGHTMSGDAIMHHIVKCPRS